MPATGVGSHSGVVPTPLLPLLVSQRAGTGLRVVFVHWSAVS
jgi:hypothetical protein